MIKTQDLTTNGGKISKEVVTRQCRGVEEKVDVWRRKSLGCPASGGAGEGREGLHTGDSPAES